MDSEKGQNKEKVRSARPHTRLLVAAATGQGSPPKVTEGDTEAGRPEQQPAQVEQEEGHRKRGTCYLCGLNMAFGNSRGNGKS